MCSTFRYVFFRTHIIVFVKLFVRLDLEKKRKKSERGNEKGKNGHEGRRLTQIAKEAF